MKTISRRFFAVCVCGGDRETDRRQRERDRQAGEGDRQEMTKRYENEHEATVVTFDYGRPVVTSRFTVQSL